MSARGFIILTAFANLLRLMNQYFIFFANTFDIKFDDSSDRLIWPVFVFEFISVFGLDSKIVYSLSHPADFSLTDNGIP